MLFIATSNFPQAIDQAFISRADLILSLELPGLAACQQILEQLALSRPVFDDDKGAQKADQEPSCPEPPGDLQRGVNWIENRPSLVRAKKSTAQRSAPPIRKRCTSSAATWMATAGVKPQTMTVRER